MFRTTHKGTADVIFGMATANVLYAEEGLMVNRMIDCPEDQTRKAAEQICKKNLEHINQSVLRRHFVNIYLVGVLFIRIIVSYMTH